MLGYIVFVILNVIIIALNISLTAIIAHKSIDTKTASYALAVRIISSFSALIMLVYAILSLV